MQILLVEDDEIIAKGLIYSLRQSNFGVVHKSSIMQAKLFLEENSSDFIILDISLPDGNGFEFYEKIIKKANIPSIFLTAKDDENDIVRGLELGAEDYITKPFSTKELIARINKVFLREKKNIILKVMDIEFDLDKMAVYKENKQIELTSLELKILHLLFINIDKVVTRDEIIYKIWEWTGNDINDNTVTVYLKRIREKIKTDIIKTIKGIGYRIDKVWNGMWLKTKNNGELKKIILISIFTIFAFTAILGVFSLYKYKVYTHNFNQKIEAIISRVLEQYPNLEKREVVDILNNNEVHVDNILREYGIDKENDSIIFENDENFKRFIKIDISILMFLSILLLLIFLKYNRNKDKKLQEITKYIQEINKKNYKLDIDDNSEEELSILKNEIYKTTVMLKEQAENSIQDKINIKNSLSDISHQLKTPLTSIIILLDNIIDNPNMDMKTREEFIKDIKRETININFLIQVLLKLSKFDSNTIIFTNKKVKINDIINEAIKNVSVLCDLKDIKVEVNGDKESTIYCDEKWQIEAITNILKNSVEHSNNSSKIQINYEENKIYTQIKIIDTGKGIDEEDKKHIFDRFYKGKNSSKDSVGIGLALSKSIIEKNNGVVYVESKYNKGTTFIIKYFWKNVMY